MPIQPLSDATSRILTSTQTLDNAVSVVKELVDNALDACAHSISIEIAANTLDKIIVKDDGLGIGVEDRQLLCRHGCTSKITDLDDLASLGGTFLGFRGTALASIAKLSKEVTIITKVDGEQPATTMTFSSSGELLSSASASHNDGTTVRVEGFLVAVHVRKQVVLKSPSKVIDDVKKLLQGYAFARPTVKLSLRVLKAKNNRSNWSFAACKDENRLLAAAVQVADKRVADSCRTHSIKSEAEDDGSAYQMEALLLETNDPDVSFTGLTGQYIAIDGRPVSQEKGVIKDLVKKYKTYLQQASGSAATVPSKPFLAMHIRCPEKSYDVNVEPAKDVVLFHNQSKVLDLAERLFAQFYGELKQASAHARQDEQKRTRNQSHSSFDVLLASKKQTRNIDPEADAETTDLDEERHRPVENNTPTTGCSPILDLAEAVRHKSLLTENTFDELEADLTPNSTVHPRFQRNMYTGDDDFDVSAPQQCASDNGLNEEEVYDPKDVTINNPFARAKAFAVHRCNIVSDAAQQSGEHDAESQTETSLQVSLNMRTPSTKDRAPLESVLHLPTPTTSPFVASDEPYQNPGPPFPRRNRAQNRDSERSESNGDDFEHVQPHSGQRQTMLADWISSPLSSKNPLSSAIASHTRDGQVSQQATLSSPNVQFRAASHSMQRHPQLVNKPFRSPLKHNGVRSTGDQKISSKITSRLIPSTRTEQSHSTDSQIDDDLQQILDFEHRKKAVNRHRRQVQDTLKPADLARIQQGSMTAANLAISQASQLSSDDMSVDTSITSADAAVKFSQLDHNLQSLQTKGSNPHHNRFQAALRHLESQRDGRIVSRPANDSGDQPQPGFEKSPPESTHSIDITDPRGFFITLQKIHSHPNAAKVQIKRAKSSQLPFERIPTSAIKHDILAIPMSPFPPTTTLSEMTCAVAEFDPYVKAGKIPPIEWSLVGNNFEAWQEILQVLVEQKYRTEAPVDEEEETNQSHPVPHVKIQLATALKGLIDDDL